MKNTDMLDDDVCGLQFAISEGIFKKRSIEQKPMVVKTLYSAEGRGENEGKYVVVGNTDSLEQTKEIAEYYFTDYDIIATDIYSDNHQEERVVEEVRA